MINLKNLFSPQPSNKLSIPKKLINTHTHSRGGAVHPEAIFTSVLVSVEGFALPWKIVFEGRYASLIGASPALGDGSVPSFLFGQ